MSNSRGSSFKFDVTKRRSSFLVERATVVLEQRPKIIVATEGETERFYLTEMVRTEREKIKVTFIPADNTGSDPRSVVEAAIRQREFESYNSGWDQSKDTAYAVFDGDEHTEGHVNKAARYHEGLSLARGNNVQVIISNPSCEEWFLLHFQYSTAPLHRDAAKAKLKEYIPDYEKASTIVANYKQFLRERIRTAVVNAQRLRVYADESGSGIYDNPCCHMDKLIIAMFGGELA